MRYRIVAIILLFALISSNFSRFYAYAGFNLNRSYIAQNLCANKARPWLRCGGKCYFMQKVKQAAENEKKQAAKNERGASEVSFFESPFVLTIKVPVSEDISASLVPHYDFLYHSQVIGTLFRPPKATV